MTKTGPDKIGFQSSRYERVFADSKGYFFLILHKTYVLTPHLNGLIEMVHMRGHNIIMVSMRNKKKYH